MYTQNWDVWWSAAIFHDTDMTQVGSDFYGVENILQRFVYTVCITEGLHVDKLHSCKVKYMYIPYGVLNKLQQ